MNPLAEALLKARAKAKGAKHEESDAADKAQGMKESPEDEAQELSGKGDHAPDIHGQKMEMSDGDGDADDLHNGEIEAPVEGHGDQEPAPGHHLAVLQALLTKGAHGLGSKVNSSIQEKIAAIHAKRK